MSCQLCLHQTILPGRVFTQLRWGGILEVQNFSWFKQWLKFDTNYYYHYYFRFCLTSHLLWSQSGACRSKPLGFVQRVLTCQMPFLTISHHHHCNEGETDKVTNKTKPSHFVTDNGQRSTPKQPEMVIWDTKAKSQCKRQTQYTRHFSQLVADQLHQHLLYVSHVQTIPVYHSESLITKMTGFTALTFFTNLIMQSKQTVHRKQMVPFHN